MAEIDRDSPQWPFEQIAEWIRTQIRVRNLSPDTPIPSEKTLTQEFPGVARTTIRRAIRLLREEGVVYTVPRRGTFVAKPSDAEPPASPEGQTGG